MKDSANKFAGKTKKAFTLIELLVTLAIITILATASVPQVQKWTARNRGMAAVSNIISDFAKARAIGEYSMDEGTNSGSIYENYTLSRPLTAIMFRQTSYSIIQRPSTKIGDWKDNGSDDHTTLKKVALPLNVAVMALNTGATNDGAGASPTLVLTSNGNVKQTNNLLVPLGAGAGNLPCGTVNSTLDGRRIFVAVMKSTIVKADATNGTAIWYRVEIDTTGEYFICMQPGTDATQPDFLGENANIVEI